MAKIHKPNPKSIKYQETYKKGITFNEQGKKDVIGYINTTGAVIHAISAGDLEDGTDFLNIRIEWKRT